MRLLDTMVFRYLYVAGLLEHALLLPQLGITTQVRNEIKRNWADRYPGLVKGIIYLTPRRSGWEHRGAWRRLRGRPGSSRFIAESDATLLRHIIERDRLCSSWVQTILSHLQALCAGERGKYLSPTRSWKPFGIRLR